MLVDKKLIDEAKGKLGDHAASIIAKDLGLKEWDEINLKGCCFNHEEKTPSLIWNPKENCFHCFGCSINYGIIDHYMSFYHLTYLSALEKLFKETDTPFRFAEKGVKSKSDYRYPSYKQDNNRDLVEKYLATRHISKDTLDKCDVQQYQGKIVFNFYDENDVLLTVKLRPARTIEHHESKEWFLQGSSNTPILYNMNKVDPSKPLVITEGECFPPETEILTEDGWKRFDQYNNENVLVVDEYLNGHFEKPTHKLIKNYAGEIWKYKKYNFSFACTPNHNIVHFDDGLGLVKTPLNMMPKSMRGHLPTAIQQDGEGIPLSDMELALFIAVSADGTLDKRKGNPYVRIAFKKERKVIRLQNILDNLKIKYCKSEYNNGFTFFGFTAPDWLKSKKFDHRWISFLTLKQKQFIIKEMVYWDGNFVPNRNQTEYSSTIYDNASFIQTVASLCGYMSNIKIKHKGDYKPGYCVSILFGKENISWQGRDNYLEKYWYEGKVYCVTVSTGMILTRYENHISIMGNCDTLSVIEAGYSNCVSVPGGTENLKWIEECFDWLERFDEIIFFGDNDNSGIKLRKEVVSRLGAWRTKIVDLPRTEITDELGNKHVLKDANDVLVYQGKDVVLTLIATAEEMPLTGVVDLANVDDFDLENAAGLKTNLAPLDKIVYKFLLGNVVIITGQRGSGKSSLVNQIFVCNALQQDMDVFIFSGELSAPLLKSWIELTMAGPEHVTMKDEFIHVIDPEVKQQMRDWYSGRIWVYDDAGNDADHVLNKAIALSRKYGIKIWVLDNLLTLGIGANDNNLLQKQDEFVSKLTKLAQLYNVLIALIIHPRKLQSGIEMVSDDIKGSGGMSDLAQYLLFVKRISDEEKKGEMDTKGRYKKGKEPTDKDIEGGILKNRLTGKTGKMQGYFHYPTYRFHSNVREAFIRYDWDKSKTPLPKEYPPKFINNQPDILED